jgi:ABC-type uncharacterized transport system ATPase component
MTSPIDPIRNTGRPRRAPRPKRETVESAHEVVEDRNLPVATGPVVTHEPDVAAYASRTITFKEGKIIDDSPNKKVSSLGSIS